MAHPGYTINIHLNDDVVVESVRIGSSDTDFVSFRLGSQASVFVMNTDQAKALIDAAEEAFYILRTIEDEKARAERARAREVTPRYVLDNEETDYDSQCTIDNPCPGCQDYLDSTSQAGYDDYDVDNQFDDYEPQF